MEALEKAFSKVLG